jgi:hypothetical protein
VLLSLAQTFLEAAPQAALPSAALPLRELLHGALRSRLPAVRLGGEGLLRPFLRPAVLLLAFGEAAEPGAAQPVAHAALLAAGRCFAAELQTWAVPPRSPSDLAPAARCTLLAAAAAVLGGGGEGEGEGGIGGGGGIAVAGHSSAEMLLATVLECLGSDSEQARAGSLAGVPTSSALGTRVRAR